MLNKCGCLVQMRGLHIKDGVYATDSDKATLIYCDTHARALEWKAAVEYGIAGCVDAGIEGDYGRCLCRCRAMRKTITALDKKTGGGDAQ